MPIVLTEKAKERSTYAISVTFKDDTGATVTPNAGTVTWTLTDSLGTVVNSRDNVAIASASTVVIVLSGLDLAIGGALHQRERRLLIQAEYDSDLGADLPLTEEIVFSIEDFVKLEGTS